MKDFHSKTKEGYTLIELIIYAALVGVIGLSLVYFVISVSRTRNKAYAASEVQANTRFAIDFISSKIRLADGVNVGLSTFGADPGVLSLSMADPLKDPTVFALDQDDGRLMMTEGAASPVFLTSGSVRVSRLFFSDNTPPTSGRENIAIELTVEYGNQSLSSEFDFSQEIRTAVTMRR